MSVKSSKLHDSQFFSRKKGKQTTGMTGRFPVIFQAFVQSVRKELREFLETLAQSEEVTVEELIAVLPSQFYWFLRLYLVPTPKNNVCGVARKNKRDAS